MTTSLLAQGVIDEIRALVAELIGEQKPINSGPSAPRHEENLELRRKLSLIRAKEFITVAEAALLLSCSDAHIRNLVGKAKKGQAKNPIPFRDLDGVTVFALEELLAWSQQPKTRAKPNGR